MITWQDLVKILKTGKTPPFSLETVPELRRWCAAEFEVESQTVWVWMKTNRLPPHVRQQLVMTWPEIFHDVEYGTGGKYAYAVQQKGIDLIKSFEGFSLTAYHGKCDRAGLYTIGWGHARGVRPGDKITLEQAEKLLRDDIRDAENVVNLDYVSGRDKPLVTQNQFDALVSFVFNVKRESYLDSTLRRKLKAGDKMGAAGEFKRWIYADHKIAPGLISRRDAERKMFLQGGAADIAALLLGVMLAGSVLLVAMLFMM